MKTIKLAILALMTIISTTVNSQNKAFATYTNGFGKSYDITVTGKDTSKYDIWIDAHSMDVSHKIGGIMVRSKSEDKFIIALTEAKAKYAEWLVTAKTNGVKDLYKEMEIKCKGIDGYFAYGRDYHFNFGIKLSFFFVIKEVDGEITYRLVAKTGEMTASDNQFMEVDGVALVFNDEKEIDSFINTINHKKIIEYLSKPKAEDLFKD